MLGPGLNILSGGSWQVAGLSMLYLVAIIGAGLGLVCVLGPPGVAIVALTTMTLGNATSSANVPVWFLPDWRGADQVREKGIAGCRGAAQRGFVLSEDVTLGLDLVAV
jgi:hypothetical protein